MLCEPDVRWEGRSHKEIHDWVRAGRGAAVTERLEARLAGVTEALHTNSDQVTAALRRVHGGEWTGGAATTAAAAMRVMRDFDDVMGHHGVMNGLAAYGQSDNAAWAKANVPPYVDLRAQQVPTGTPLDAVHATADHQHQARAAKEAEERARQVMREYHAMTTSRVAALPPLPPAPRLVVTAGDTTTEPSGPGPGSGPGGPAVPRGERPGNVEPGAEVRPDGTPPAPAGRPDGNPGVLVPGRGAAPTETGPSRATAPGNVGEPTRSAAAADRPPGPDAVRGPLPDGGQPVAGSRDAPPGSVLRDVLRGGPGAGPRGGPHGARPGVLGAGPGTGGDPRATGAGPVTGAPGRAPRGAGPVGVVPGAAARAEDDKEHRGRYAVPESAIFEPDNDDGLLHDPFRPGSYVAPASIGDDDE